MDTVEIVDPHYRDNAKAAACEARLPKKRYCSVDPENRLVAAESEKGWEEGLHSARGEVGIPTRFVTEIRRAHRRSPVSKVLRACLVKVRVKPFWEFWRTRRTYL